MAKTTTLRKRVSCGMVLMASTMLHEKCCNTVLQIGAPLPDGVLHFTRQCIERAETMVGYIPGAAAGPNSIVLLGATEY